jgi:hypothetical protein
MLESRIGTVEDDQRGVQQRSRVMLAAAIVSHGFSVEARIRNLSRSGALIEGEVVPEAGTTVEVLRNDHSARAEVVWAKPGRCGVKFESPIVIEDWVGSLRLVSSSPGPSSPRPSAPRPPAFTDADSRPAAALPAWLSAETPAPDLEARLPARVGEEIAYVQRLIDSVGRDLSSTPLVGRQHAGSVATCRSASALLGELARVLLAEDRVRAAGRVAAPELKARLLRS